MTTNAPAERLSAALADRYRIERELGAGGMATVYLAHDVRHDRRVALKVLRPELAAVIGAERFLAEIKTTASLQHPHILPLFDSGTAAGFLYYVMPFIQGETIREKLNRETQFGIDEAVRITREVADALDCAHRHGVIHRDIKPENILLHDGRAMVMDFGIALAVSAAAGARLTETGLSLGTPHYMSPEQATAEKDLTPRTDIYSLGVVLYEMLAGEPPHLGGSAQAVIMKIITESARLVNELRRSVPPNVVAAVARAVEKVPADRFESSRAFADALGTPGFGHGAAGASQHAGPATAASRTTAAGRRALIGVSTLALLATTAAGWAWLRPVPAPRPMRFDLTVGPAPLARSDVSISPDGTMLTYSGTIAGGSTAIFVRRLTGEADFRMLAGTETGGYPAFSPDNQWIVFHRGRDGALIKIPVAGGVQTTIVSDPYALHPHWGTRDQIVYAGPAGIFIVPASGGTPKQLPGLGRKPFLLPDGSGVLGNSGANALLYDLRTKSTSRLQIPARNPVYTASGHVIYDDDQGGLSAVPFDLERHRVTGRPVRVLDRVASTVSARAFSVSDNGTLVQREGLAPGAGDETRLVIHGLDGRADTLPLQAGRHLYPRFSPDGRFVAYSLIHEAGATNIYTYDLNARTNTQLTFGGVNRFPVWSPDGKRILYAADSTGTGALLIKSADNSDSEQVLVTGAAGSLSPNEWPRSDLILYTSSGAGPASPRTNPGNPGGDLMTLSLEPGAKPRPYDAAPGPVSDVALSPDGRYAAFTARGTSTPDIWLREFPTPMGKWKVSTRNGGFARWSPDGSFIYYLNTVAGIDSIFRVRVNRSPAVVLREPELVMAVDLVNAPGWDIHPDGKRLIVSVLDLPLAGAASPASSSRFVVILNWFTELRQLTAARKP